MKVKELIEELQKRNLEKIVVVPGYEGGYDEISGVGEIPLKYDAHTEWYYGKHDEYDEGECLGISIRARFGSR